jgi:hypothetical protein
MDTINEIQAELGALRIMVTVAIVHSASLSGDAKSAIEEQRAAVLRSIDAFNIYGKDPEGAREHMRTVANAAFDGIKFG